MTEWILDADALQAAHEQALQETRKRIRATVDQALEELGVSDPERREQFHSRALQLAMPIGRSVIGEDIEEIRRRGGPATHH